MPTITTKHAAVRQQQRGIPMLMVDLLLDFGSSEPSGNGTSLLFFDKPAKRRWRAMQALWQKFSKSI